MKFVVEKTVRSHPSLHPDREQSPVVHRIADIAYPGVCCLQCSQCHRTAGCLVFQDLDEVAPVGNYLIIERVFPHYGFPHSAPSSSAYPLLVRV